MRLPGSGNFLSLIPVFAWRSNDEGASWVLAGSTQLI